jgi:hypothetical protein
MADHDIELAAVLGDPILSLLRVHVPGSHDPDPQAVLLQQGLESWRDVSPRSHLGIDPDLMAGDLVPEAEAVL